MTLSNKTYTITLLKDDEGYIGRECPNEDCLGHFKIFPGTGLSGINDTYCPYCGTKDNSRSFSTQDQIEYVKSIVLNSVKKDIFSKLKKLEFSKKPRGNFGIGIELQVKEGVPFPIHRYREKNLETKIECSNCSLKYEIYGVFGYCPDCGQYNSLQIFCSNLNIVERMLENLWSNNDESNNCLLEAALSKCISLFDGYGREICKLHSQSASDPEKINKISFQNILTTKEKMTELFGINIDKAISDQDWAFLTIEFQKRHLIMHKLGVIDEDYIRKARDPDAIIGRKIIITQEEIRNLIRILKLLSQYIEISFREINQK